MALLGKGTGSALLTAAQSDPGFSRLKAVATVEQVTRGKRIRGRVYVMFERPSTIRLDTMSPADTPLSILVADSQRFELLDVGGNVFYTGPPSSCNVAKLLSIPMSPEAVVDILSGIPPLIEATERRVEFKPKGYHLLTLQAPTGDLTQTVQMVSGMMGTAAIRSVVWRGDSMLYDLRFREHSALGHPAVPLPREIQFTMPSEGTTVTLRYGHVEIDPDLDADIFDIDPPAGLPVHPLTCNEIE